MSFGSEAIRLLQQYEVDTIFGIPGVHTIEYYRGIHETGIRSVVARHEQGAGFMADAYSRIAKKPGVCILVSGPGVLNAATPIAQAWHDSIPILILAASTESSLRGRNRGPLHDVPDQALMLEQLTNKSITITDPNEFPAVIAEVYQTWATQRPRPVHISIPTDLLIAEVSPFEKIEISTSLFRPTQSQISQFVELARNSTKPLMLLGGGSLGAQAEIRALAEKLSAVVINTGNARGILPDAHPLNAGTIIPFAGARNLVEDSDLVIAIGTEFSEVDYIYSGKALPTPKKLVRVDIDTSQLQSGYSATLAIHSDAREFAVAVMVAATKAVPEQRYRAVSGAKDQTIWSAQSISHFPWIDAISSSIPANTIVSIDSTQLAYTAHHYMPWSDARSWLAPYGLGTLGPGLPMGVGARVAAPDRPVLVIAGDGGSLFTISEMATAIDVGGPLVTVIWDNAGYGEIRDSFDRAKAARIGVDIRTHDLVMIAKGFGMQASRVFTPEQLSIAIKSAFNSKVPTVIVVTEPKSPADIK